MTETLHVTLLNMIYD